MIESFVSNPFYWIGVLTSLVFAIIFAAALAVILVAVWMRFAPELHCRRPGAINVWSTFRSDIRGSEGERVKGGEDMRIDRLIGCSWRLRWYFGLITFTQDDGK